MPRFRMLALSVTAAAVLVGTGGCGSSAGHPGGSSPAPTVVAPTTGAAPTEPTDLAPPVSTAAATGTAPIGQTAAVVRDIRVARHDTYDRLVIDLSGPIPGYRASYVSSLIYDASGAAVPLQGTAYLRIALNPAGAHDPGTGADDFFGARLVPKTGFPALRGYAVTGDFEAVVSVGMAVGRTGAAFRVITLTHPNRIVVDIAH